VEKIRQHFYGAAASLASDRSTTFVGMIVGQMIFIGSIGIAFAKAIANQTEKDNWTNIYAYAISMSIVFLHICPILGLNSLIGVSQSESQVPKILNALKFVLDKDPD
jgi:uncharacterized membrane protein SpoIIM required for sporulation